MSFNYYYRCTVSVPSEGFDRILRVVIFSDLFAFSLSFRMGTKDGRQVGVNSSELR
jgi:hypothetical protein